MSGRYGPYVTDGTINATLPKGTEPDEIDLATAVAMLAEKAAKGGSRRRGKKKPAGKKKKATKKKPAKNKASESGA